MERLTEELNPGYPTPKHFNARYMQKIISSLANYERTGLTPEEIEKLKERDTAKVPNKKLRHRGGFETCHCPNCDTSYQIDGRYTITDEYCPICGKLLDSAFGSFCANCGQRISRQDWNDMQERKKRICRN